MGPAFSRATRRAATVALLSVLGATFPPRGVRAQPASPSARAEIAGLASKMTGAELARWTAPLADPSEDVRRAAAQHLEELGSDATPAIAERLADLRREDGGRTSATATAIRDARRARGADLMAALVGAPPSPPTTSALVALVYARALARASSTPAARALVQMAADHGGALRPELARALVALGERAVPALLEARAHPSADARVWATAQLEAQNKRIPADAVQTRDPEVLADVLAAFATTRDMDALPVVLSFVNTDRSIVRTAARDAVLRYGQDARGALREAYANVAGKPAADAWTAAEIARQLFGAYDRYRLQEANALVDEGLARHAAHDLPGAIAAFDRALARQPLLERRSEMVAAYVALAQSLEERDRPAALAAYRKAAHLDPPPHRVAQIEASIAYLEAVELEVHGVADPEAYRHAIELDPTHTKSRAALDRLELDTEARSERTRRAIAAAVILMVGAVGVVLFGRRPRPARP